MKTAFVYRSEKELYRKKVWAYALEYWCQDISPIVAVLEESRGEEIKYLLSLGLKAKNILAVNHSCGKIAWINRSSDTKVHTATGDLLAILAKNNRVGVIHYDPCNALTPSEFRYVEALILSCLAKGGVFIWNACKGHDPYHGQERIRVMKKHLQALGLTAIDHGTYGKRVWAAGYLSPRPLSRWASSFKA